MGEIPTARIVVGSIIGHASLALVSNLHTSWTAGSCCWSETQLSSTVPRLRQYAT